MFAQKEVLCKRQLTTDIAVTSDSPMVLTVRALENAIGALREKAVAVHNRLSSVLCPDTEAGKVPVPTDRPQEISAPLRCVLLSDADRVSEVSDILDDILKRLEI